MEDSKDNTVILLGIIMFLIVCILGSILLISTNKYKQKKYNIKQIDSITIKKDSL